MNRILCTIWSKSTLLTFLSGNLKGGSYDGNHQIYQPKSQNNNPGNVNNVEAAEYPIMKTNISTTLDRTLTQRRNHMLSINGVVPWIRPNNNPGYYIRSVNVLAVMITKTSSIDCAMLSKLTVPLYGLSPSYTISDLGKGKYYYALRLDRAEKPLGGFVTRLTTCGNIWHRSDVSWIEITSTKLELLDIIRLNACWIWKSVSYLNRTCSLPIQTQCLRNDPLNVWIPMMANITQKKQTKKATGTNKGAAFFNDRKIV